VKPIPLRIYLNLRAALEEREAALARGSPEVERIAVHVEHERHGEDHTSTWPQRPEGLVHEQARITEMFEDLRSEDAVEPFIAERQLLGVGQHVGGTLMRVDVHANVPRRTSEAPAVGIVTRPNDQHVSKPGERELGDVVFEENGSCCREHATPKSEEAARAHQRATDTQRFRQVSNMSSAQRMSR